ncbi:hypothetical protein ACNJX9_36005 [Bradyrhizobium sp. DASA03076]|uniref:hypothetical protein n=1 Tax=Bradyrhizobium sp. BLXBL-03 TaxID=3395916 RepID=UPI003F700FB3
MTWQVTQLMLDYHNDRGIVSIMKQAQDPTKPNDYSNVSVNFPVADNDQEKEGESALRQRTKQLLIDAANSL